MALQQSLEAHHQLRTLAGDRPVDHDTVIGWCRAVGVEPVVRRRRVDFDARQFELETGDAVAIIAPMHTAEGDALAWRPIAERPMLSVCLVSRAGAAAPLSRRAVDTADAVGTELGWDRREARGRNIR